MKKTLSSSLSTLVLLATLAIGLSQPVHAAPAVPPAVSDRDPAGEILASLSQLNVTDSQKVEIAEILKSFRGDFRALVDRYIAARQSQFEAIHQDVFNEQAVRRACRITAGYEEELAVLRADLIGEIRQVLTEEQKKILADTKATLQDRILSRIDLARNLLNNWVETHSAD